MKDQKKKEARRLRRQERKELARKDLRRKWREERGVVIVYFTLRILVIGVMIGTVSESKL